MDYVVHGILQARILEWVVFPFSGGSSQTRDRTQVYHIAGRFFTSWATREAQEYWVGSLSLLQRIILIQESNRGLLHCRRILYRLCYQGIPHSISQRYFVKGWEEIVQKYLEKTNQPLLMAPLLLGRFLSDLVSYRIILSEHMWLNPGYQETILRAKIVDCKHGLLSSAEIKWLL